VALFSVRAPSLQTHTVGAGRVLADGNGWRLYNAITTTAQYSNAQLDDYTGQPRHLFPWRPPLRLRLRARFSHPGDQLCGTAGFGFWNDPLLMGEPRLPTLPRALWFFFSSPPSNLALALDVPGPGWKAATIDGWRWPFLALAPTAPLAMPLMRIRTLYRRLWPIGQRAIGVHEALLPVDMTCWHTYCLEWHATTVRFLIDDHLMLAPDQAPRGPLGLVIWKDNQAMTLTPWSLPRQQLVACPAAQWLEVADLTIGT